VSPEDAIAALDRILDRYGEDVTLTTIADGLQCQCRAFVRGGPTQEIERNIAPAQADIKVIMSATALTRLAQRPAVGDPLLPRRNDKVTVHGRQRNIESVAPIYPSGELVRVDLTVRGGQWWCQSRRRSTSEFCRPCLRAAARLPEWRTVAPLMVVARSWPQREALSASLR
jgi:hypothetical protein